MPRHGHVQLAREHLGVPQGEGRYLKPCNARCHGNSVLNKWRKTDGLMEGQQENTELCNKFRQTGTFCRFEQNADMSADSLWPVSATYHRCTPLSVGQR